MKRTKTVENVEEKRTERKTKKNLETYLKDFLVFIDTKLKKPAKVLIIISIVLIAVALIPTLNVIKEQNCVNMCRDQAVTFVSEYLDKLTFLGLTLVAGFVPYVYVTVLGFVGYILEEVVQLSYIIDAHGYLIGTLMGIIPLILNILVISLIGATGLYMCKNATASAKISKVSNMNFTNLKIQFYEAVGNVKKKEELEQRKEKKLGKLKNNQEKNNYLQILNVVIVAAIIQLISVAIQEIII